MTQRQARVPKPPLFCSATKAHTRSRASGGALHASKEKSFLIWRAGRISVFLSKRGTASVATGLRLCMCRRCNSNDSFVADARAE
jgi:hypothetical protein